MMNYVYILRCNDQSLYTGWTTNLERRVSIHNAGKASKYTRSRLPVQIVYSEQYENRSDALKRECAIKKLSHGQKSEIVKSKDIEQNRSKVMNKSMEKGYTNKETAGEAFEQLIEIISYLRSEQGCPWDREQTHESLKKHLIEEAYEVIDAIDKKDKASLEEELGDLLLQVVFHSLLGEETEDFNVKSVIQRVSDKMIYRHPHVFSKVNAETIDKALITWENMKRQEKSRETHANAMLDIPKELPALMKSNKIQKKAADVGFDWDDVNGAFEKVKEETRELEEIYSSGDKDRIREEIGDLLFSVVNVSRFSNIDPEEALNETTQKFISRFQYMEDAANRAGVKIESMSLAEMDKLWEEAKRTLQ